MTNELEDGLADLILSQWRALKILGRAVDVASEDRRANLAAQARYAEREFASLLERMKVELTTFDGEPFSVNLPVLPINADELAVAAAATIGETIEPSITQAGRVLRLGRVVLKEGGR